MNDRLYRSRSDRMIAGVAGGLADLWDADPSLIRIVWALLVVLTGGLALVVYIIMAIVVPDEDEVWPAGSGAGGIDPAAGAPPAVGAAGAAAADTTTFGAPPAPPAPSVDPTTGQPLVSPPPAPGALWAAPPPTSQRQARADARAARRAVRAERRGTGSATGAVIGGLFLVALGVFFLAREWLPQIDFDWFWPLMLIVLGVIVLIAAVGRRPSDPGPSA
jgi:phage shock protein C